MRTSLLCLWPQLRRPGRRQRALLLLLLPLLSVAEGQQLIQAGEFKDSADLPVWPQHAEDVAVVLRSCVGSQDHGESRRVDELQLP